MQQSIDERLKVIEFDANAKNRKLVEVGYQLAVRDFRKLVGKFSEKGLRCMNQSADDNDQSCYTFWDGFHNCAENIQRELEDGE